ADVPAPYRDVAKRLGWREVARVPLVIREQVIGDLTVANRLNGQRMDDSDFQLLTPIATQIAAMIDRMRLYATSDEALRARVDSLERLGHIARSLHRTVELDRILEEVRGAALRSTGASGVSIVLFAPAEDWPAPDAPLVERRLGEDGALTDLVPNEWGAVGGEPVVVDDYAETGWAAQPARARSALSVPLLVDGAALGVLHLFSSEPRAFDARAQAFVDALADEAAIAIASARRYQAQLEQNQQLRTRADHMDRIFEVGELFRRGAALEELLAEVAQSVRESVG